MKQMFITVGISGSGKSTWAKELCQKDHSFVRVNRDSFRKMLVGYKDFFQRDDIKVLEEIITLASDNLIKTTLINKNVIIDNTHLSWSYILHLINLAQEADTFVGIKMFDVELDVAKNRVYRRDNGIFDNVDSCEDYADSQEWIDYSNENSVKYIDAQYQRYRNFKNTIMTYLESNNWYKQGKIILLK